MPMLILFLADAFALGFAAPYATRAIRQRLAGRRAPAPLAPVPDPIEPTPTPTTVISDRAA